MVDSLERSRIITRRDMLHDGAPDCRGALLPGIPEGRESLGQPVTLPQDGIGNPVETLPAESPPLHHPSHSRHQVTQAVTRGGIAARSLREYSAKNSPTSTHLAAIADDNTLFEQLGLKLHTNALLPDVAHQTYEAKKPSWSIPTRRSASQTVRRGRRQEKLRACSTNHRTF